MIIDGKKIKDQIMDEVETGIKALSFKPVFCDILVGNDKVSSLYVRIKSKAAELVGIQFRTAEFDESITTEELIEEIKTLNSIPNMCGIIVQLPLPNHINRELVLNSITPELDVDCIGKSASTNFYNDTGTISYPTALACMAILDSIPINLNDKKIVVLGQGNLVGKPVTHLLEKGGLTVDKITRETENSKDLLASADVVISAIGQGKFITGEMVKEGVVLIDAGTSEDNGAVVGDVDLESVLPKASYVTPSPGGVGPVTVAMLLRNVLESARIIYKK